MTQLSAPVSASTMHFLDFALEEVWQRPLRKAMVYLLFLLCNMLHFEAWFRIAQHMQFVSQ